MPDVEHDSLVLPPARAGAHRDPRRRTLTTRPRWQPRRPRGRPPAHPRRGARSSVRSRRRASSARKRRRSSCDWPDGREELVADTRSRTFPALDDDELARTTDDLREFERELSDVRRELHGVIDALDREIADAAGRRDTVMHAPPTRSSRGSATSASSFATSGATPGCRCASSARSPGSRIPTSARSSAGCASRRPRSSRRSPRGCASRPRRCTCGRASSTSEPATPPTSMDAIVSRSDPDRPPEAGPHRDLPLVPDRDPSGRSRRRTGTVDRRAWSDPARCQ